MSFYFFATIHHWSWSRFKKGEFIEDESYEWRDAVLDRRLGVRIREIKYFIFFREIRYKQRERNYWIEKAGGWRIKIPFCKTYEETRIGNRILLDLPLLVLAIWMTFSHSWSLSSLQPDGWMKAAKYIPRNGDAICWWCCDGVFTGWDCSFAPQGLRFPILNLDSIDAKATCMVEKTCLCRSVDINWHNNGWRPKYIFWML